MDAVYIPYNNDNKNKKMINMPKSKQAKTYSLDKKKVENLKKTMDDNEITYRADADAIHMAINKYIADFKLNASTPYPIENTKKE